MEIESLRRAPELLGFDPVKLSRVEQMFQRALDEKLFSAVTYIVFRQGRLALSGALGTAQPDSQPQIPSNLHTIFDAASISKTITATLLLQLVETGEIHLEQNLSFFFPQAKEKPAGSVTLKQLATHTSGLPAWIAVHESESPLDMILDQPLETEPGSHYTYSDLGYILIGGLLEKLMDKPLPALAHDHIFKPLGMLRTAYNPDPTLHQYLAATTAPLGQVHDPNARGMGGAAGHAGLFTTAPDLARFALSMMHIHGEAAPLFPPPLGPMALKLASTSQIPPEIGGHTIGWFAYPSGYLPRGDLLSTSAFGHTGFTGTLILLDPVYDLILIMLTNRVYYEKENDGSGLLRLRRLFANAVAGSIITG